MNPYRFRAFRSDHGKTRLFLPIYDDQEALKDLELVMAQDLIIPADHGYDRPDSA